MADDHLPPTCVVAIVVGGLVLALIRGVWAPAPAAGNGGAHRRASRLRVACRGLCRCRTYTTRLLFSGKHPQRSIPQEREAERRRVVFVATHRATLDAARTAGHYTALVITAPTPPLPTWVAESSVAQYGYLIPTGLQLAQRRLAFALSQLANNDTNPFSVVSEDLMHSIGEVLATLPVIPPPLRFNLAPEGGYILGGEDGAAVRPTEGLRYANSLRLAVCADEVMRAGRHCAAFTVVRMGPWNGMYIGVTKRPGSGQITEDAPFWGIESSKRIDLPCVTHRDPLWTRLLDSFATVE